MDRGRELFALYLFLGTRTSVPATGREEDKGAQDSGRERFYDAIRGVRRFQIFRLPRIG
jgi:hypothetical protein